MATVTRTINLLLFFALLSCTQNRSNSNWVVARSNSDSPCFSSALLKPCFPPPLLSLEWVRLPSGVHLYIVTTVPIASGDKIIQYGYMLGDTRVEGTATAFKGNEKFLVAEADQKRIQETLCAGEKVTVLLGPFSSTFQPDGFDLLFTGL